MSDGPLWSKDESGTYWLLFPNKHALTKEEIRSIFSEFGKVLNITAAGDERGFRFVQFSTEEDVERAVDSLEGHPTIRLLPHRPRAKNKNKSGGEEKNENDKRNFYQRKTKNDTRSNHNTSADSEIMNHEVNNFDYGFNDDKESTWSNSSGKFRYETQKLLNSDNLKNTSPTKSIGSSSPPTINSALQQRAQKLLKFRSSFAPTVTPESHINGLQATEKSNDKEEIPGLIGKEKVNSTKESKKLIFPAEEIIVANIHNDYGSAYILHLFEEFEPLAVSYIKVLPKSETRYCHVYFKSVQDSVEVETQFDKYNLEGKKLVVLRPCMLMEEVKIVRD